MRTRSVLVSTLALALLTAGPALAQQPQPRPAPPAQQKQQHQLSQHDMNFAKEAALGGMAEVDLGKLAQQNGHSDQVKQFGARMVQDHGAANDKLKSLAADKGLTLPQQLDQKHQQTHERLAKLRGAEFDRAYMRDMVADHDKDMKEFRQAAQRVTDPDLKTFAQQTLPTIEEHDRMAHDIMKSMATVGSSQPPRR